MNAANDIERQIWVAVFAGEAVWSRKATDTTNMASAHRTADNAVAGFRSIEADLASKAAVEKKAADLALIASVDPEMATTIAAMEAAPRAAEQQRKSEKQQGQRR